MTEIWWDVVGVGENSVDHVLRLPALPAPGAATKMQIRSSSHEAGGQVVTTLCTCVAMGLRASYIGAFGSDDDGQRLRRTLAARGLDLAESVVRPVANRSAVVLVDDRNGDRVVMGQRDAALALAPETLPRSTLTHARAVHVDGVDEAASIAAARIAREAGAQVTCDLEGVGAHTGELLRQLTVPILAQGLPEAVTGASDPERALRRLDAPHARLRCVTMGAQGALLLDGDRVYRAAPPAVDVVDTTGAGDVFRGAFIVALLRGEAPDAILRFANAAAALSCTKAGALGGVPTLETVEQLLVGRV
ncbi:MAG TPA: carbohydrate kinase family protein [Vicinamibacterales bacterium]|nr:carbohydrate kinase family protein [Vicinamibacterales bacterium]